MAADSSSLAPPLMITTATLRARPASRRRRTGWTNAILAPRPPVRGVLIDEPGALRLSGEMSAASMSGTAKAMWCRPWPAAFDESARPASRVTMVPEAERSSRPPQPWLPRRPGSPRLRGTTGFRRRAARSRPGPRRGLRRRLPRGRGCTAAWAASTIREQRRARAAHRADRERIAGGFARRSPIRPLAVRSASGQRADPIGGDHTIDSLEPPAGRQRPPTATPPERPAGRGRRGRLCRPGTRALRASGGR